jgi:tRNA A-37 threonylcarbamoyl transferase component Bud32
MNIALEKEEIILRFNKVNDVALIKAIKNFLDFGMGTDNKETLEQALDIAMEQSRNREVRAHEEVIAEIRKKYK